MGVPRVAIVGNSSAAYVCAIYLHTANIPVVVFKTPTELIAERTLIAGCPSITTNDEFVRQCCEQVKHMGIEVRETEDIQIEYDSADKTFVLHPRGAAKLSVGLLAVDENSYDLPSGEDGLFVMADQIEAREAIVIAGAGCKVAFDIKERA